MYKTRKMPNGIMDVYFLFFLFHLLLFFFYSKKINKKKKWTRIWLRNSFRGDNLKKEQIYYFYCMWHSYLTWYIFLPNMIKLSQTILELWPEQDFGFKEDVYIKQKLSFLHAILLLDLINVPTKYYQIISHSMGVMTCTRFQLQGR